ncbi:MAG TPA: DUF1311 domain-containing protein [Alphaproteobacteria bacterium]|nr:DUF1311 domain-containing protein [Alphaproteobacteria bacterium]
MRFLIILSFCLFITLAPQLADAQNRQSFCGEAESTAAIQNCLKKHLDSAQKRLNVVYKKLADKLGPDNTENLKDLQQTWLRYRDSECMWESARTDVAPLKRANELSCMVRITEDRADLLTISLDDENAEGIAREYGSFPRWMNVVAKENADYYWDYGKRASYDLNCDDENEFVMMGAITKANKIEKPEIDSDESKPVTFEKSIILAVTTSPAVGRPVAKTFIFPVRDRDTVDGVCSDAVSFEFAQKPEEPASADEAEDSAENKDAVPACRAYLKINNKGCEPKIISWTGKDFALEIEEKTQNKKEEDKK